MKYHGDRKYLYWGLTAFLVICGGLAFYYFLFHGTKISSLIKNIFTVCFPIIVGFVLAYLLTPIVNSIEKRILEPFSKKVLKKEAHTNKRLFRVISILFTYIIVSLSIYGLVAMIIPEIVKSLQSIISQIPTTFNKYYDIVMNYINSNQEVADFLENNLKFDISTFSPQEIVNWIGQHVENIGLVISTLSTTIFSTIMTTLNIIIGIIISVYLLYGKENFAAQAKKIIYSLFEMSNANRFIKDMRFIHKTFIGFISGKIVDSIIIGILCFAGTTILGLHYPTLISVIVGVTNVIPFFGPYLGAIPCAIMLLLVEPIETVYFLIFILVLQQVDGNIIGPKILGDSTGINGFWVIFAITFFGGIYGIPGMFIGVPVFAVIYAFTKRFVNRKLTSKELPTSTYKYRDVYEIKDNEFISKEHLYTEIKNPKYTDSNKDMESSGKYHFFHFLSKDGADSTLKKILPTKKNLQDHSAKNDESMSDNTDTNQCSDEDEKKDD